MSSYVVFGYWEDGYAVGDYTPEVDRPKRKKWGPPLYGISDAKTFCKGGRSLTSAHSPTLVVLNPEFVEHVQHSFAAAVGTTTTTRAGKVSASCGGSSKINGSIAVTSTSFVESAGVAVIPVLGRSTYSFAVVADSAAVAYGNIHISANGVVNAGSRSAAKSRGSFSVTDAHFCSARGERRLPPSHSVAISALAAHGRFRRHVDTR